MWGHAGAVMTVITTSKLGICVTGCEKAMPNAIVASGLSYYSVPGTALDMYINRALASML
jgi:hypothetical protein